MMTKIEKKEMKEQIEKAARFRVELNAMTERAEKAERYLAREGYVPCDIPACNCGSWHRSAIRNPQSEIRNPQSTIHNPKGLS